MKRKILFLIVVLTIVVFSFAPVIINAADYNEERFVTITLHAGEEGFFESSGVKEKDSVQFRGEAFSDRTIPDTDNPNLVFVGWATTPDAESANVFSQMTHVSMIGTDLYAVWTDKCSVYYHVDGGYITMDDGQRYSDIFMNYNFGQNFQVLQPTHVYERDFDFAGWYEAYLANNNTKYTEETIVNKPEIDVVARWKFAPERMDRMELDEEDNLTIIGPGKFFAFTPEETAVYEVYTKDKAEDDSDMYIAIMDENTTILAISYYSDELHNATVRYTMEAGKTYFFQIREMAASPLVETNCAVGVRKANCAKVTFHINRGDKKDVWFDDDPNKITKEIPIAIGEDINSYKMTGINFENSKYLELIGWSINPNADWKDEEPIIVENDMDVYAVFRDLEHITLDANGGYFALEDEASSMDHVYVVGTPFSPRYDPHNDDNTVKFAGWSKSPNATVPDEDIIEAVTICDDLPRTLYAVYTEKILETFDANGGYLLNDKSITTYESTKGVGHVFYGLALFNSDERMVPLGWTDQNGEFIPYTPDVYPYYHIEGDTHYTAVWGYKVTLDANGGTFPLIDESAVRVTMEHDGLFSVANVRSLIGEAVNSDSSKYFAGWATTPDAQEPDVIDGKTPVKGLDRVYAVWKTDSYYFEKGEKSVWEKGSPNGLQFIIKRAGDDSKTFPSFNGIMVDENALSMEHFDAKEGSLILNLNAEYLDTLDVGSHEIVFHFNEGDVNTSFTIDEKSEVPDTSTDEEQSNNPKTSDDFLRYLEIMGLSAIGFTGIYAKIIKDS